MNAPAEHPDSFVSFQKVDVTFGKGKKAVHALHDINLNVREGEFVSLIGHSGCGKSTLLNLVAGFVPSSAGRTEVGGEAVTRPGPSRMMVFQHHALLPWLTVRANVEMAVRAVSPHWTAAERLERVDAQLEAVDLAHAADKHPAEISGGMKQRAGIARALVTDPDVLLMDEPFGALDALTRGKLQDLLLEIWERNRITVLMVTHDVDEAVLLSDRVVMMNNGPRATIGDILDVDLPRPRDRVEAVNHPEYYRYRNHLTSFLRAQRAPRRAASKLRSTPDALRLGYLPLSDAAPLLMARELRIFEEHGLTVDLSREPSWRAVSKGVIHGDLDAAMMLAPTPLFHNLNPDTTPETRFRTGMVLSRNGNAITLRRDLAERGVTDAESFGSFVRSLPPNRKPSMGVVFPSSMHNLLLRDWLVSGGLDPDKDVNLIVIPPPQMVANLELGNLVGFCVGEPWNSYAVQRGIGCIVSHSGLLRDRHPEKVLGYAALADEAMREKLAKLITALREANAYCSEPGHRERIVETLSRRDALNLPPAVFRDTLFDRVELGLNGPGPAHGFHLFPSGADAATEPERFQNILRELVHWNLSPAPEDPEGLLDSTLDPLLFSEAALRHGEPTPSPNAASARPLVTT